MRSICGLDCETCAFKAGCAGCTETGGKPFGGGVCPVAACCSGKGQQQCKECTECGLKARLMDEFNALGIKDMPKITQLYALAGSIVNVEHTLPSGQNVKFWNDNEIYLGGQVEKEGSDRCYGLAANDEFLLVCEYGENGADPQIVVYKQREKSK